MALPILPLLGTAIGAAARGLGGIFVRRSTTVGPDGEEHSHREPTRITRGVIIVLGLCLLWHFVVWPILNYHFPEYGFPAIDAALLSVLAGLGG